MAQKSQQLRALYAEYQQKKGEAAVSGRAGRGCFCAGQWARARPSAEATRLPETQCASSLHMPLNDCPPPKTITCQDLRVQFQSEREDLLADYRTLSQQIKLKNLIIANFIPPVYQEVGLLVHLLASKCTIVRGRAPAYARAGEKSPSRRSS